MSNKPNIRMVTAATLVALLLVVALSACGSEASSGATSGDDPGNAEDAPDFTAVLDRAPPELATLYENAGKVLPAGDYEEKLTGVEGYPAVVNIWASWCGPCRTELPHLQDAAAKYLDQVAFMGVDVSDTDSAAETFLSDHPMPYPSFADPGYDLAIDIEPSLIGQPHTVFLDGDGEVVHVKYGPYVSADELDADIEKYSLSS